MPERKTVIRALCVQTWVLSSATSAIQTRSREPSKPSKAALLRSSWSPSTITSERGMSGFLNERIDQ